MMIRLACEEDLESIVGLLNHLGYPITPSGLLPILRTMLQASETAVFVASLNGCGVVGLMSLLHFPTLRLNGRQVTIEELVVHPGRRGKGIGRELIAFARTYAQDLGAVMIEVLTNRKRESFKRGFYEKNGFTLSDHSVFRLELQEGPKTIA
jgi:GNAT superfamily N-acetyltransferase